jgi:homeobox protein HoxA/B/C/D4
LRKAQKSSGKEFNKKKVASEVQQKQTESEVMSSFLMSYPHVQGTMGAGYEPKFPPSESDFHHLHHHAGYGAMNGIAATTNHMDYNYHNGYNYNYGAPSPSTPFYHHHHPPYGSPQMHHPANAPSPNIAPQTNSYVTNVLSNNNSASVGNRNSSTVPNSGLVNSGAHNVSESAANVDSLGYYNSYYANTNGHLSSDLPIQCPSSEPPANTALGLQELGKSRMQTWQVPSSNEKFHTNGRRQNRPN